MCLVGRYKGMIVLFACKPMFAFFLFTFVRGRAKARHGGVDKCHFYTYLYRTLDVFWG